MIDLFRYLYTIGASAAVVAAIGFHAFSGIRIGFWCSILVAGGFLYALVRTWFRRSSLPDVLGEMGYRYVEREGLCFVVVQDFTVGRNGFSVLYQNRYAGRCRVDIMLRPSTEAADRGLKRHRMRLEPEGGDVGRENFTWDMPEALNGLDVTVLVGADVEYPNGRGRQLRVQEGVPVTEIKDLEAGPLMDLLQPPTRFEFTVPLASGALPQAHVELIPAASHPVAEGAGSPEAVSVPGARSEPAIGWESAAELGKVGLREAQLRQLIEELDGDPDRVIRLNFIRIRHANCI